MNLELTCRYKPSRPAFFASRMIIGALSAPDTGYDSLTWLGVTDDKNLDLTDEQKDWLQKHG